MIKKISSARRFGFSFLGLIFVLAAGLTPALASEPSNVWTLDSAHSNVSFSVKHLMISNVRGSFSKTSGTATYDPKHPERLNLDVTIDPASISTQDAKRDAHLKGPDFFDTAKFPTILFKVTKYAGKKLYGKLTLRGVTKDVVLDLAEEPQQALDPWGGTRVAASATTTIDRKDFGMNWNKSLDNGGLMIGNQVMIQVDAEFVRK